MKYTIYICPSCGSEDVEFWGFKNGCGDYGDEIYAEWTCLKCNYIGDLYYFGMVEKEENAEGEEKGRLGLKDSDYESMADEHSRYDDYE